MEFSVFNPGQSQEIIDLFTAVFSDSDGKSEGLLIGNLAFELIETTDSHELFGFVAKAKENIVGCIFFSRITFESGINAYILAPVAIDTNYQGKGVGQKLITFRINFLKDKNVDLVFTYGDPDFYSKVGFRHISEECVKAPLKLTYPEGWLGQSLIGESIEPISGKSYCVNVLKKQKYW